MMSEAVQIALIGVGGAVLGALLTAFVQPLWTALLGKQSKLHVEIFHHQFQYPKFFQQAIFDYVHNYKLNIRPTEQIRNRLRELDRKSGLSQLKISNHSKRSIEDIVIHLEGNGEIITDLTIDGETQDSQFGRKHTIGSLRAGGECKLAIWTPSDLTGRWSSSRTAIHVSAKEYDKISLSFPAPEYVTSEKILISRKLFWRSFWFLLLLMNVLTVGSAIIHSLK
jgi:hypothetical protein